MNPDFKAPRETHSAEELERRLREALKAKRPRPYLLALIFITLALTVLAVPVWFFYARIHASPANVIALDDIGVLGQEIILKGVLESADAGRARLAGRELVFLEGQGLPIPGQQSRIVHVQSGPDGEASCVWKFGTDLDQVNFTLRLLGEKYRPRLEDHGLLNLYPAQTPLCLVPLEALAKLDEDVFRKKRIQDIAPEPGAAAALREIQKSGQAILYLALAPERAGSYQTMRYWVNHHSAAGPVALPSGVVLGRFGLPVKDRNRPWQNVGARLKAQFPSADDKGSSHVALAATAEQAQEFEAAGLRTFSIGERNLGGKVERAASWEQLPELVKASP